MILIHLQIICIMILFIFLSYFLVISANISQIGGKFRLRKELSELTPLHAFFSSLFCGACWYELNKPRVQYECFNDKNSEYINYLEVIRCFPKRFDELKEGLLGLVSQKIFNDIVKGILIPENIIERAYFFYLLNKIGFSGSTSKGSKDMGWKGFRGITTPNARFRGTTPPALNEKIHDFEKNKANFRDIGGKGGFKGINPKTTRPYTNNDMGVLTPLDPEAIIRLRYVVLTCYDFRKMYKMYHKAYFIKKGLTTECFIFADPPYPSAEKYYGNMFKPEDHYNLIDIMVNTPFRFLLTIGGECGFYIDALKDAGWYIIKTNVKYSTDANTQKESIEYICMNYNIKKIPIMKYDDKQKTFFVSDKDEV